MHVLPVRLAASPVWESVNCGSSSGLDLLWQASCLHLSLALVTPAQGETGLSEGEWQAKPVLTQHLKPPHKYRLPFPISKLPIHLWLHAYTLLRVMRQGVSLKMTTGHLVESPRVGLWCAALQFSSTSGQPNPTDAAVLTEEPGSSLVEIAREFKQIPWNRFAICERLKDSMPPVFPI